MFTLREVIAGLMSGSSYERFLNMEMDTGKEYLTPTGNGCFNHLVVGNHIEHGGWGGSAELPLDMLNNGHWDQDGWELSI